MTDGGTIEGTRGGVAAALLLGAGVEPAAGEGPGGLVAEYGALREEPPSRQRTWRLGELIARLLRESGAEAALQDGDPLLVRFRLEGRPYVLAAWWLPGGAAQSAELGEPVRGPAAGARVVALSMSGFDGKGARTGADGTVLWDRSHLEALVCGLTTLPDLLEVSMSSLFLSGSAYTTLARLLAGPADVPPAEMATPDLLPPPWDALGPGYNGIQAQLVLGSGDGWDKPSGIAAVDDGHLVVVTGGGLVSLDLIRGGQTSWLMRLPGCANEPLVLADGSVLAVCGSAIVRVAGDRLEAVAGGFDGNVHLLAGPGGEPWALSGHGVSFGPGDGSLALTRLGAKAGDQHRYDIYFQAKVNAAGWLGGLRFFLASTGHSAVVDLARSTRVPRDSWIESPQGYEQQLAVTSTDSVVTAAGEPTGIGVTLFRTDVSTRTSTRLAKFELNAVDGLCITPDGTGYLLGDMHAGRPYSRQPWPVLLYLPGLRPTAVTTARSPQAMAAATPGPATAILPASTVPSADPPDPVRKAARGQNKDYALDRAPLGRGGQAEVFRATHKASGMAVAFKRLRPGHDTPDAIARMRREIEAAQAFGGGPHVVPVLDFSNQYTWFVMPLADRSAADALPELGDTTSLRALVTAICQALRPAHKEGWVHRDLKPENLLWLDGTWAVADWGLTRRPRGQTTDPDRTRTGVAFGTDGWAAPELSVNAHDAKPPADVYSIGQIIGWALTGQRPQANIPLLPPGGPWRQVVRAAAEHNPERRPATVDALLELIAQQLDYGQPDPADSAGTLLAAASEGDATAAAQLFALAASRPDDARLYTEVLPAMPWDAVCAAVDADHHHADEVVRAALGHVREDLSWGDAARIITWLYWITARAGEDDDLTLLEEALRTTLAWDAYWDQWTPRDLIRRWLGRLRDDHAAAAAQALREYGDVSHFRELADDRNADERIRRAVRPR